MNRSLANKSINLAFDVFDSKSIESVIAELEEYKSHLSDMMERFVKELCEAGLAVAQRALDDGRGDSPKGKGHAELSISDPTKQGSAVEMRINFSGDSILFIEFGAGIYFNNGNANPKAAEFGMGVGTYPGQKFAINPGYWWYKGEDDKLHFSRGTEAAMPMYKASLEVMRKAEQIAKRTFW